jgi:hypothetical protein
MTKSSDADTGELREALRHHGCAICHLADRATVRYMRSVAYEQVNDPALRAKLRASGGFCTTHAHRWLREAKSVLGTALIYRDAISAALRELESTPSSPSSDGRLRKLLGRAAPRREPVPMCAACRIQHDAQDRYVDALIVGLSDAAGAKALATSDGLCLPHTRRALERGGQRAQPISARAREVGERFVEHLSEVIRKEDYRFQHEPRSDAERTAPRRAVAWTAGMDGLVSP